MIREITEAKPSQEEKKTCNPTEISAKNNLEQIQIWHDHRGVVVKLLHSVSIFSLTLHPV